jgi:hypothetical protein
VYIHGEALYTLIDMQRYQIAPYIAGFLCDSAPRHAVWQVMWKQEKEGREAISEREA